MPDGGGCNAAPKRCKHSRITPNTARWSLRRVHASPDVGSAWRGSSGRASTAECKEKRKLSRRRTYAASGDVTLGKMRSALKGVNIYCYARGATLHRLSDLGPWFGNAPAVSEALTVWFYGLFVLKSFEVGTFAKNRRFKRLYI